jgi:hypothetical protein
MRRRSRLLRALIASFLLFLAFPPPLVAEPGELPELRAKARQSRAEQLRATTDYKATLDRLLAVRESEVQRAEERMHRMRGLADQGMVARADLDAAERAVTAARRSLDQAWGEALLAASLIAKVLAAEELANAETLRPGTEQATASLVRYRGRRPWSLALTPSLQDFFSRTFSRAMPVSAYGQTAVHDTLGFDHRNAIDVAVHPDSPEGLAVMDWLRRAGLSFIAFRNAVPGAATGAHIHVGEPSQRLALP